MLEDVTAEQFTGQPSLQQGFFDRYQVLPDFFILDPRGREINDLNREKFVRTLEQLRRFHLAGIAEEEYAWYIKGALVVVNYWEDHFRDFNKQDLIEGNYEQGSQDSACGEDGVVLRLSPKFREIARRDSGLIIDEKEDLLKRLHGLDSALTDEQKSRLEFLRWLIKSGRISETL